MVSSAEKEGMEVVSVVINSPQMWERTRELLDYSFNTFDMVEVLNKNDFNDEIYKNSDGLTYKFEVYNSFLFPLTNEERKDIKFLFNGKPQDEFIKNPTKDGVFEIFLQNKLIFSQNIFTIFGK